MLRRTLLLAGFLAAAFVVWFAVFAGKPNTALTGQASLDLAAEPINRLDRFPSFKRAKLAPQLRFEHGITLTSRLEAFGGLSGLHLSQDGTALLAVTDTGHWLRAAPVWRDGQLVALEQAVMAPIQATDGRSLRASGHGDIEAMAFGPSGAYLADESYGSTVFFAAGVPDSLTAPTQAFQRRAALKKLPKGRGIEALAYVQRAGLAPQLLAIAERHPDSDAGVIPAWLLPASPDRAGIQALHYEPTPGFDVSDAAFSTRCGLFVLERKLNWLGFFEIRLKLIQADSIQAGNTLKGLTLLATDSWTSHVDNLEGVSVMDAPDGSCEIFMISDDNFLPVQSTNLLQFRLFKIDREYVESHE
jgi:hypothetical protein